MKFILRFLVVFVALTFVSVHFSFAQTTYTVKGSKSEKKTRISKKLQEMKDALSLSDEQIVKIQTLTKESREQGKSAADETDAKAKRAASKERSKTLESNIIAVLTPDQAKKYEQWKLDQKEERKHRREEKKEHK